MELNKHELNWLALWQSHRPPWHPASGPCGSPSSSCRHTSCDTFESSEPGGAPGGSAFMAPMSPVAGPGANLAACFRAPCACDTRFAFALAALAAAAAPTTFSCAAFALSASALSKAIFTTLRAAGRARSTRSSFWPSESPSVSLLTASTKLADDRLWAPAAAAARAVGGAAVAAITRAGQRVPKPATPSRSPGCQRLRRPGRGMRRRRVTAKPLPRALQFQVFLTILQEG